MSTYELDDDLVRGLVDNADLLPPRLLTGVMALKEQIPLPAPTKVGAVVRTNSPDFIWVRWRVDGDADAWVDPSDGERRSTGQIGRIVEVLSEGVDQ